MIGKKYLTFNEDVLPPDGVVKPRKCTASNRSMIALPLVSVMLVVLDYVLAEKHVSVVGILLYAAACVASFVPFTVWTVVCRKQGTVAFISRSFLCGGLLGILLTTLVWYVVEALLRAIGLGKYSEWVYIFTCAPIFEAAKLAATLWLTEVSEEVKDNVIYTKAQFVIMAFTIGLGFQTLDGFGYFAISSHIPGLLLKFACFRILSPMHAASTALAASCVVAFVFSAHRVTVKQAVLAIRVPVLLHVLNSLLVLLNFTGKLPDIYFYVLLAVNLALAFALLARNSSK